MSTLPDYRRTHALVCATYQDASHAVALNERLSGIGDWSGFLHETANQRLLPVTYWLIRQHGLACPPEVRRIMASAYVRQKSLAEAQTQALCEVVAALTATGIDSVVLKGGVLAHTIYPEPGLRPMDDVDILVPPDRIEHARQVLLDLDFRAPAAETRFDRLQHQLPIAQRTRDGHTVCVELHHSLFNRIVDGSFDYSTLERPLSRFALRGVTLQHLAPLPFLWMHYRGLRKLAEPLRTIQLLDMAVLAERLPERFSGEALRLRHPELWHALHALDEFVPLSAATRQFFGMPSRSEWNDRDETGLDYTGWPRNAPAASGVAESIRRVLRPPAWWARFFYGLPSRPGLRWWITGHHLALFLRQGVSRLYLGPAGPRGFFKPSAPPPAVELSQPASSYDASAGLSPRCPQPAPIRSANDSDRSPRVAVVTCMYNGLDGTAFGGRRNRDEFYRQSLAVIAESGVRVYCFIPAADLALNQARFAHCPNDIVWMPLELADHPFSPEIQRIKAQHPEDYVGLEWKERCVEIMWGKFAMLERVLRDDPAIDFAYWVDAGLANTTVLSPRYRCGEPHAGKTDTPVESAFPLRLFDRLRHFGGNRLVAIECTALHNRGIPEKYNERPYQNAHAVIAGLFGGPRERMLQLCERFDDKCRRLLADEVLFFEEGILTGIHADHPEWFETFTFDSWYHEGWASHDPAKVNFSEFFDLMLGAAGPESKRASAAGR